MCCCGLNTILNLPANIGDKTDGAAVDVSGLQGKKTIQVSGSFLGTYSILGSHDGNLYFPVASFGSGASSQSVSMTLDIVVHFLKVHREAPQSDLVTINVASRSTVACATSGQSGANNFFTLATLPKGASGVQPVFDLFNLVASTGVDVSSIACGGSFSGQISVEASLDGLNFSPLGGFLSSQAQRGSPSGQSMFDPLVVEDVVRYMRVNVLPGTIILGPTSLTLGGPQNCDCIGGCALIYETILFPNSEQGPMIYTSSSINIVNDNSIPWETFGNQMLKVTVTVDARSPTASTDQDHAGEVVWALNDGAFSSFITPDIPNPSPPPPNAPALTVSYQNFQMVNANVPPFTTQYVCFLNPGTPLTTSFYNDAAPIHSPLTTTSFFQNVHVKVYSGVSCCP